MGTTPAFVGASCLAVLALLRLLASATPERVFIVGRSLRWGCLFQRAFGLACPTCGMTRGVLLTLHGHISDALRLNPAAPLLVAGMIIFAVTLIFLAVYQATHDPLSVGKLQARLRLVSRAYAGLLLTILFAHWLVEILPRLVKLI